MKLSSSQVLIVFFEKSQKKYKTVWKSLSLARACARVYILYYYIYILYFIIIYYYIFYLSWIYYLLFKHYARVRARETYTKTQNLD